MMYHLSVILLIIGAANSANETYKLCAVDKEMSSPFCTFVPKHSDRLSCLLMTDTAKCAMTLAEGKADFGVMNAEEMHLVSQFYSDRISVMYELRSSESENQTYEFEFVVIVPSSFNERDGLAGLKGSGLCHPGFSNIKIWSDWVLKYFEKTVYKPECHGTNITASENEILNLKDFFGSGCRPGLWVSDKEEDKNLKSKYHELCELCDDIANCEYRNKTHNGNLGALECLSSGRGKVAYATYKSARAFFKLGTNLSSVELKNLERFKFLCKNGTTIPLTSSDPCAWIKQPWRTIVAQTQKADEISEELQIWLTNMTGAEQGLELLILEFMFIFTNETRPIRLPNPLTLKKYLPEVREVNLSRNNPCGKMIRWCTPSKKETDECEWIAKGAIISLDAVPHIECLMANSTLECFKNIADSKADITKIDSNHDPIDQQELNHRATTYEITRIGRRNQVIAVIRENATDSCDYSPIVAKFFSGACTPGIRDSDNSSVIPSRKVMKILCSSCPPQSGSNAACSANLDNYYYSDREALECVKNGTGDVAIVKTDYLFDYMNEKLIDPKDYRVLCKNGNLKKDTGFNVDEPCALSITINSKENPNDTAKQVLPEDVTLILPELDNRFGSDANVLYIFRIYKDLKKSSNVPLNSSLAGLVSLASSIISLPGYEELFSHAETCRRVDDKILTHIAILFGVIAFVLFCYAMKKCYVR